MDSNVVLIRLDDDDRIECDFIIREFNRFKLNLTDDYNENEKLLIKRIDCNQCIDDILMKICDYKNVEELFVEKARVPNVPTQHSRMSVDEIPVVKTSNNDENLALQVEKLSRERVCVICLDRLKDIVFLPCTHLGTYFYDFDYE